MMDDDRLNQLLDAWRVEPAPTSLRDAVLAGAPGPRRRPRFAALGDARLWFAGLGLVAGLAGVSCGAAFVQVAGREARDEAMVASAVPDTAGALAAVAGHDGPGAP